MKLAQKLTSIVVFLVLTASAPATTEVPRKSPDFTIIESSGRETLLSSFKGQVIVIEFLFLGSARCLRAAQTLNQLYHELGPRGFQPVAIVFGPRADLQRVNYLAEDFRLTYPVGYASPDKVDLYLSRGPKEILNIPQIVVIDREGLIRAQSGDKGSPPTLENVDSLRNLIDNLLNEQALPTSKRTNGSKHHF